MAKKFNIADAYAAQQAAQGGGEDQSQGGDPDDGSQDASSGQPLTIQPQDVATLMQLKQQGDQSGDYSALGKAFAQILDAQGGQ